MPGLPKNLQSTYQKYKNHTHRDSIAQWLASTARKNGYAPAKGKAPQKPGVEGSGRPTYTVATKERIALAEFITGKEPPITVPIKLATLLDLTISLRQSHSMEVSNILDDTAEKRNSDDSHTFFLDILNRVRTILEPRLPKDRLPPAQPQTTEEIVNMFEHLELEEPSESSEAATRSLPAVSESQARIEPIYKAKRTNDIEESFFAFSLLLHDLIRLRSEVSTAWAGYKDGMHDLVAASITTNTAVDLTRSEAHRVRPGDDINFKMYKDAEALFWPASQLLTAFCDVLKVNPTPEMKHGIYGFYEPHSDRDGKTNRDKFKEDKNLLLEMLPEFFYYCRITESVASRPPVEDEFSRGLRDMFKTKEVTLPLVFAATLFLDIHHMLRHEVDFGFQRLTDATHFVQGDIKEEMKFHEHIDMPTWPKTNDLIVQQFVDTLQFWCHEDQQLDAAKRLGRVNIPERFHLYRKHPWLCGLWKYYAQMRFHEISITFVYAWGAVMSCAHFYNAVGGGTHGDFIWKDLDVIIPLQDEKIFFIGEVPTAVDDCLKRFALVMGASATNLAKSTRKKKGLTLSKRGAKGLKELGAVLQTFKGRFCDGNGQNELRTEDVQRILENATWDFELNEDGRVGEIYKGTDEAPSKTPIKHLPVAKLLGLLSDLLHAEMVEIQYDYLRLHRQCWRLLRFVKDRCREDLIRMFGPEYLVKESELPFIVGYVLMSASSSQQVGDILRSRLPGVQVTGKVLSDATEVVKGMIAEGAGALIVDHILPKGLGVQIDFEFEKDE
ncbi:hypothetical protein FB567DRAFT_582436 [Paraphoma chrysanthemicola]|uniref:DUF6604 domain-containing protein n=1 Tax=Paraphoma chrysanthemicola TaxID=798071 RepID=A0A8K0R1Q6_9PLEO|nr:hypothetical protein FB567DRAFT_582436 [Paraphoma chrysanthemicola]